MKLMPISAYETIGRLDALDFQEFHSPSVIDEIHIKLKDASRVVRDRVRRRSSDARFWGSLDSLQQNAAEQITRGFNLIVNGVGMKCQTFQKVYGRSDPDKDMKVMKAYHEWARDCIRKGINVNYILAILVEGQTCYSVDDKLHKRKGTTKANLVLGLEAYIACRHWQRR